MVGFSIDNFIDQFHPPFPNYLKLDVDGLELPILEGARRTLRDPRLRSLLVELSVSQEREYRSALPLMEEAGFHFVSRGAVQEAKTESAANHIFQRDILRGTSGPAESKDLECNVESVRLAK
jgi:hypothetical protein